MEAVHTVKRGVDSLWANAVLFAAPVPSYGPTSFPGEMCYLPKWTSEDRPLEAPDYVPCLFVRCGVKWHF